MPWLPTYGAPNLIVDGETSTPDYQWFFVGLTWTKYTRTITEKRYRYVGMTEAAADTCKAAIHDPTATPSVFAEKMRAGNGGNYSVVVTERTEGTWAAV